MLEYSACCMRSEISQNLLGFMMFITLGFGLYVLFGSLLFCVVSLIPYRKGENWAWYLMFVIIGITMFGALAYTYIGMTAYALVSIIMLILWIVGLALPAKEILYKPSWENPFPNHLRTYSTKLPQELGSNKRAYAAGTVVKSKRIKHQNCLF